MKKLVILSLTSLSLLSLGSCKKYLDINDNPNAATSVSPKLLFNYAATAYAANRSSGDNYLVNAFATQTIANGGNFGWGFEDVYDISIYGTGNTWKVYYATAGQNLMEAIEIANSQATPLTGSAGQCKILLAQNMLDCTLLFGDVPFSEAWKAKEISYPKFDSQQEVFNQLLTLLDEGIQDITGNSATMMADMFYNGNEDKWIRVANSIKLKIMMIMVDKDPSKAAAIGTLLNEDKFINSNEGNFQFNYTASAATQNPKYRLNEYYAGGQNLWFFGSKVITDPMVGDNDPRLSVYFEDPDQDFNGLAQNQEADENSPLISNYLWRPTAPEILTSYSEILFYKAEAYARGLGVAQNITEADTYYKQALTAACRFYGIEAAATTTFVDSKTLVGSNNPLDELHMQQFIDFMDRPIEAFTNWRRSGTAGNEVPTLTIPTGSPNAGLIRRWPYPNSEEISPNPNAPKNNPQYYEKLWFDL